MWLIGTGLWMVVLWVGVLLLAVWLTQLLRLHPRAVGGAVLIVIAVVVMSTFGAWGMHAPRDVLDERSGPAEMFFAWSPPPWMTAPLPGNQTLRLRMVDFAFRPSVLAAPSRVPLTLELINSGAAVHTIVIPVLGVRTVLMPGERMMIDVGSVEPGIYEFFCAIPAHREAGMIGQLAVGPEN